MSRGKKAKRKLGGRRKQDPSVVSASMRLSDIDSTGLSRNKSQTMELLNTKSKLVKCLRSKSEEIGERSAKSPSKEETAVKSDVSYTERSLDSDLKILFGSEELETLKNVLRKNDLSKTPVLLGAIILGKVDVVKKLLRDGYPINCRSEDKRTALMWAVRRKDLEMINLLVRNGADLTLVDENNDNVALIAVQSSSWEQNDFLDFWKGIDCKIDLKHVNTSGYTILHYARERRWDVLTRMIDGEFLTSIDSIAKNSCFCCYCSSRSARYKTTQQQIWNCEILYSQHLETSKKDTGTTILTNPSSCLVGLLCRKQEILSSEYIESTLSHLSFLFDEIVNRYRDTWSRDRNLGYPDFRGGHGDTAASFDDLASLRREEIARLNTVLPKLEETYLQKLTDCWSSLLTKMRETATRNPRKFHEFITSIQIQLLTHQISPSNEENSSDCAQIAHPSVKNCLEFSDVVENSSQLGDQENYGSNSHFVSRLDSS